MDGRPLEGGKGIRRKDIGTRIPLLSAVVEPDTFILEIYISTYCMAKANSMPVHQYLNTLIHASQRPRVT
jgi:hypothetical protein